MMHLRTVCVAIGRLVAPPMVVAIGWWAFATESLAVDAEKPAAVGIFESHGDVGEVKAPSAVEVVGPAEYKISAAGENIWGAKDAFHFAWQKVSGDLDLTTEVGFEGAGKKAHRKAGWMVRQSLAPDAPYADAMVHGDGLMTLQYRKVAGGVTLSIPLQLTAQDVPAAVRLERDGNLFSLSIKRGGEFQPIGAVTVALADPVYAGLAVSSHDADTVETAVFKNVGVKVQSEPFAGQRVRECSLEVVTIASGERKIVHRARESFEAPNWSPDGQQFFINSKNRIYTVPVGGGAPTLLDIGSATGCNNDHGLSPDGRWLAISHGNAQRISLISIVPSAGGVARHVTPAGPSYWHGWSPDGKTLAYCAKRGDEMDVYTMPAEGGPETRLTTAPGLDDGPDYTPDGQFIYWNSERAGLMKIWRMRADGSQQEQVTQDSDYADWFPHPSPDGKWLVFLSFDKSVTGHPAAKDVTLRMMPLSGGKPKILATLFGGQGTINVPSWSPDSKQLAFVSYRLVRP